MTTTGVVHERVGGRLALLDGLRFVAALAVVAFHYTGRDSVAWSQSVRDVFPTVSRFTLYGGFGPYLFFMISGFVVLMSAWGRSVPSFLASRVGRLFPAYWFAVAFIAAVLLVDRQTIPIWRDLGFSGVAMNMTMLQSAFGVGHVDGVFWTLWVELKFYVLVAVLAHVGLTTRRVLALCLAWPVLGALAAQTGTSWAVTALEPTYAPFFCIGIAVYLVFRNGWTPLTALVLGVNYLAALWTATTYYVQWSQDVAGAPVSRRGIALLLTLCVLALVAVTLTRLRRVSWRWVSLLGALTYPLYLVHEYPGWIAIHHLGPVLPAHLLVPVVVLLALVLAYLVHRCVERPLGPWLRRTVERELTGTGAPDGPGARPAGRRRSRHAPRAVHVEQIGTPVARTPAD
ncbi:Peptidoglycan/LPS O-acetylase OafA/YrhL, contains acyltransferase and SGNH-hydrolase domains [Klenkia soli]|uniref:Peptidoglycan/LPS O-acetylase OafA/YrhL, contains acyltransferase and SGNH-hydrolase domains n=1 Tax=Klenkia soli TaxID=1052260 RepID=A0A1H0IVD5_9ACTN|nr:acyltransferase [Klenkia soli]SDO35474.1 Peptidoglycan/LPS O-acetylase OafA/YrhL, contains acyltransferase and SGNH-hydrolase domains [Klenkia soli]